MNLMQTIATVAREDPEGDKYELARSIVAKCSKSDLVPLVAEEIEHQRTIARRKEEDAAFAPLLRHFTAASDAMPTPVEFASLDSFKALYKTVIHLGDKTTTTWGQASVEQHEQRLAMLLKLRAGLDKTIERHQEAIRILRMTGAPCLEEVRAQAA